MAPVKLKYIVSFTSQDESHRANNLTGSNGLKKWLCHPKDRSGKIEIVVQLEEATKFAFIDIGTIWCASLEIRVGLSDWPQTAEYKTLVPPVTLMSPIDGHLGRKVSNTQMFSQRDFSQTSSGQRWDRLQIICRQPYKKDAQLGISFIRIRRPDHQATSVNGSACFNAIGEKNSAEGKKMADIQKHFFGESKENERDDTLKHRLLMISNSSESGCDNPQQEALSRTAQLVLKASERNQANAHYKVQQSNANSSKNEMFSNTKNRKNGMTIEEEMSAFFPTLNLKSLDMESITIADLRHKFERNKRRKLTLEEKRKFASLCHEFVWKLTEEHAQDTVSESSENFTPTASQTCHLTSRTVNTSSSESVKTRDMSSTHPNHSKGNKSPCDSRRKNNVKVSPAVMLRRKNKLRIERETDSRSKFPPTEKDSDVSAQSDSGSDICYESSDPDEEDDSRDVITSPAKTPQMKRPLRSVQEVEKSYQDLYNQSSSCRVAGGDKEDTTPPSAKRKRKRLSQNSKILVDKFDSELSDSEGVVAGDRSTDSNSKLWLNTSKAGSTPKSQSKMTNKNPIVSLLSANAKGQNEQRVETEKAVDSSRSRVSTIAAAFLPQCSLPSPKVSDSSKKAGSLNLSADKWRAGDCARQQDRVLTTHSRLSSSPSAVSMECKFCNFMIPSDTYQAHTTACGKNESPQNTRRKIFSFTNRRPGQEGQKHGSRTDPVIDLTAGHSTGGKSILIDNADSYPQCPICLKQFPQEVLVVHASDCGL